MKSTPQPDNAAAQSGQGYPYMPLASAIKIAEKVKELGGANSEVPKSVLASELGEAEKSGGFSQKITSAKHFGGMDGHGSYKLTEIAKQYFYPDNDEAKAAALLQMFSNPPVFKTLIKRFDGNKLPSRDSLGNILFKDLKVAESWKDRVATIFLTSATFAGALDSQGFLRYNSTLHQLGVAPMGSANGGQGEAQPPPPPPIVKGSGAPPPPPPPPPKKDGVHSVRFSSDDGKIFVELITSKTLDASLWNLLDGYVQLLNPEPKDKA